MFLVHSASEHKSVWFNRHNNERFNEPELIPIAKKEAPKFDPVFQSIFVAKCVSTEDLRYRLAFSNLTGNINALINNIPKTYLILGVDYNFVPVTRLIQRAVATNMNYFSDICKPERTFPSERIWFHV